MFVPIRIPIKQNIYLFYSNLCGIFTLDQLSLLIPKVTGRQKMGSYILECHISFNRKSDWLHFHEKLISVNDLRNNSTGNLPIAFFKSFYESLSPMARSKVGRSGRQWKIPRRSSNRNRPFTETEPSTLEEISFPTRNRWIRSLGKRN